MKKCSRVCKKNMDSQLDLAGDSQLQGGTQKKKKKKRKVQHCLDANYGKNLGKRGDSKIKACKIHVHVLALLPFLTLTSITSRIPFSLSLW